MSPSSHDHPRGRVILASISICIICPSSVGRISTAGQTWSVDKLLRIVENYWNGEIETAFVKTHPFDTNFNNIYTSVLTAAGNIFGFENLGLGDIHRLLHPESLTPLFSAWMWWSSLSAGFNINRRRWVEKTNPWVFVSNARGWLSCSLMLLAPSNHHIVHCTVHMLHRAHDTNIPCTLNFYTVKDCSKYLQWWIEG